MDRRRLESAHIRYAILRVCDWYNTDYSYSETPFSTDDNATLNELMPTYHDNFQKKYSSTCNKLALYCSFICA